MKRSLPRCLGCAYTFLLLLCWILAAMLPESKCFHISSWIIRTDSIRNHPMVDKSSRLFFFGRGKGDEVKDNEDHSDETKTKKDKKSFSIPFFGRMTFGEEENLQPRDSKKETMMETTTAVATLEKDQSSSETTTAVPMKENDDTNDPAALRVKAERARLEAEKLDAELTLFKIDKLERQLIKTKNKGDSIDDLQRQLDILQAKLRGDPIPVVTELSMKINTTDTPTPSQTTIDSTSSPTDNLVGDTPAAIKDQKVIEAARKIVVGRGDGNDFDVDLLPDFVLKIVSAYVGIEEYGKLDTLNRTELRQRLESMREVDFSFVPNYTRPSFTPAQIELTKQRILHYDDEFVITGKMIEKANGNATQLALYALEYDTFVERSSSKLTQMPLKDLTPKFFQEMLNQSSSEIVFTNLYPKCTRKEGQEPTDSQIDALVRTVLPPAKFSSSSKPQKVPGGYVITGTHKYDNGDQLIEVIDREVAKTPLSDKVTVLYAPGFSQPLNVSNLMDESLDSLDSLAPVDIDDIDLDPSPVLYIAGPNIVRDSNQLGLTITSILGVATSWYLSVYPFLLNDAIGKRVDEELKLLEANLQPDLSWVTDLSLPLFVTFMGLQLVHEAAHRLTAAAYGVKLTIPTFVPSLITGITSSVTTFKTLPKNKEAMFDISAAGPLAGIVGSCVALALGCQLTLISDAATQPALPLEILRQSTLGGAIIDHIIQGSLYLPEGAPTAGIVVPLHPVAIAGYVSLVVNALSLLPIGTTDGGRLTMALFDRGDKNGIGSFTLLALLYFGLFGSDLFLFYFSFVIAFQTGNEVPARNEVDPVSFSRVIVATIAYVVAFLSLCPFK